MSMRYKGSRLSATANTPTSLTASGAWTLQQQMQANGTSTWPFVRDPQFNYVTMLLHGDGSAGANNGSGAAVTPTVTNFNADASTNNFNVTINGDARSNNFNPYQGNGYYSVNNGSSNGNGFQFSGIALGTGDFTMEAWVFATPQPTTQSILFSYSSGNVQMIYFYPDGQFGWYRTSGNGSTAAGVFKYNIWNHVAAVRSSGIIKLYLNGVDVGLNISDEPAVNVDSLLGYGGSGASTYNVLGYVSNARITDTVVYSSNFTPSTTPLTAISGTKLLTFQSNNFKDNSTNNFSFTVVGSPQVAPAQPFTLPNSVATYGSGYFDGSGDYLTTPSSITLGSGNLTIEGWIYPTNTTGSVWYDFRGNDSGSIGNNPVIQWCTVTSGKFTVRIDGTNAITSSSTFVINAWYHVALVRSGTTVTLYVNGTSQGTYTTSTSFAQAYVRIGAYGGDGSLVLTGYASDMRAVVGTAVYTTTFTPPTSPLTAVSGTSLLTTQYNGGGNNSGFKDSSQNNFAITRNGNTTQGTFAPYGSNWSNYFDGNADYLTVPASVLTASGDFTIECWINAKSSSSNTFVLSQFTSGSGGRTGFGLGGNVVQMFLGGSTNNGTTTISYGTWTHLAFTRSGTTFKAYVNGTLDLTVTSSVSIDQVSTNIGGDPAFTPALDFGGYISNMRVTNTVVYTGNFTPSTTPLTAISGTRLLTCQTNRFQDNSTNNYSLTLTGTPSVQRFSPFANATAYNPATTGGSAYFAGSTTNYLNTAASPQFLFNGNFTIEGWFYKNATGTFGGLFGNYTTNAASNWTVQLGSSNQLTWYYDSAGVSIASTFVVGQWNHVACVRNGSTLTMYLNGVSVGTATFSTAYGSSSKPFLIGTANTDCINGYVSDVRVVNGTALYTAAFTPPTAPLTPTPSTQLLLSTTNSAILDQSMMNDLETVGNAQISTSVVKYGTASMYFDGTGDWLTVPYRPTQNFGTGAFTIEMWAYLNSLSASYYVPAGTWGSGTSDEWLIQIQNNGSIRFLTTSGSTFYSASITTATWYHIAVVRNGSTVTIYVNGTSVGSYTCTNSLGSTAKTLYIGTQAGTWDWNGYIDDFRITNGVARYTTTFTPPTQALPNG